jgi:hypothetical protein
VAGRGQSAAPAIVGRPGRAVIARAGRDPALPDRAGRDSWRSDPARDRQAVGRRAEAGGRSPGGGVELNAAVDERGHHRCGRRRPAATIATTATAIPPSASAATVPARPRGRGDSIAGTAPPALAHRQRRPDRGPGAQDRACAAGTALLPGTGATAGVEHRGQQRVAGPTNGAGVQRLVQRDAR